MEVKILMCLLSHTNTHTHKHTGAGNKGTQYKVLQAVLTHT